ncbi:MAG: DUF2877 domain-containing protein [Armatimonadota bacterium]|nr:DUF2877 domain-containing protein [Armatimonadota bacterium]MDR7536367.1 DUF2877 domain-containing protein [Armatimonadota bacterium]
MLPALQMAAPLVALRPGGSRVVAEVRVLAAFRRSVYLALDATTPDDPCRPPGWLPVPQNGPFVRAGRLPVRTAGLPIPLVALTSAGLEPGPFSITVAGFEELRAAVEAGARTARLHPGVLTAGDVAVDLRAAAVWDPTLSRPWGAGDAPWSLAARAAVERVLAEAAPRESLAGLLFRDAGGYARTLEPFARALDALDTLLQQPDAPAATLAAATDVAGRGPGLTPSGDDLLCGVLLATWAWPGLVAAGRAETLRAHLAGAAVPQTTRVGAAYLIAARRGWALRPWHRLVGALDDAAQARRAALDVLAIGETSGADALTGFCWAWRRVPAPPAGAAGRAT